MSDSEERRNFPRSNISLGVKVKTGGVTLAGEVQNLTVEGIAFTLDGPLSPGARVDLELVSSDGRIDENTLQAEILRCKSGEDATDSTFRISAKLIEANDQFLMDALALVHGRYV